MEVVRCNGTWVRITPKPYEPERQTHDIAWSMILNPSMNSAEAYRKWYVGEQENAKVLYPAFRKDGT
jgi:hypothetical protein